MLLRWLRNQAAVLDPIETAVLRPNGIPDVIRLAELLLPRKWWDRLTPEQVAGFGFSLRPGTKGGPPPAPEDILELRARKAPLLIVMDEAHTLDLVVGRTLLNACQEVRQDLPLLLVPS